MLADKPLMIFLHHMASSYPSHWCDLQLILEGSLTRLSNCFNHMLSSCILYV